MKKAVFILFFCCFFGLFGFSLPSSHAADSDVVEIPEDQPDLSGSSFDMPVGDVMIDDSNCCDYTIVDQSGDYQGCSIPISDSDLVNLNGRQGLQTLASYISQHFDHHMGAAITAQGVIRTGYGDCWGLSDFALQILVRNGYTVKLVQGRTSEASNHRWLEVQLQDGSWTTFDPTLVTKKYGCKPYWHCCGHNKVILGVYGD